MTLHTWIENHAQETFNHFKNGRAIIFYEYLFPNDEELTLDKVKHYLAVWDGFDSWQDLVAADEFRLTLAKVMMENVRLTDFGMGVYDEYRLSPEARIKAFMTDRKDLAQSYEDVAWTISWIKNKNIKEIKSFNKKKSSYRLKHLAEPESPKVYITNGVFIAAALLAGFKIDDSEPNPHFNMSERSLAPLRER